MNELSATAAKQNFGEALRAAATGPVAISKHGRVVAVLAAAGAPMPEDRRLARERQMAVELRRLIKHQQIAIALLSEPGRVAARMIDEARGVVDQWERSGACSQDYIVAWRRLLALPVRELAVRMCGDLNGWGNALRQNSPFRAART